MEKGLQVEKRGISRGRCMLTLYCYNRNPSSIIIIIIIHRYRGRCNGPFAHSPRYGSGERGSGRLVCISLSIIGDKIGIPVFLWKLSINKMKLPSIAIK